MCIIKYRSITGEGGGSEYDTVKKQVVILSSIYLKKINMFLEGKEEDVPQIKHEYVHGTVPRVAHFLLFM